MSNRDALARQASHGEIAWGPKVLSDACGLYATVKGGGSVPGSRSNLSAHGGRIRAENKPEGGATFWSRLPV